MKIDVIKAIKAPFSDPKPHLKLGIATLILSFPFLLLTIPFLHITKPINTFLTVMVYLVLWGYAGLACNREIHGEQFLPDWTAKKPFITGFLAVVINIIYLLMVLPFFTFFVYIWIYYPSMSIIADILAVLVFFVYVITYNISLSMYFDTLNIKEAFYFRRLFKFFKAGVFYYLIYALLSIVIVIAYKTVGDILIFPLRKIIEHQLFNSLLINKFLYLKIIFDTLIIQLMIIIQSFTGVLIFITVLNLLAQTFKSAREKLV
jgi:hypothetical protein